MTFSTYKYIGNETIGKLVASVAAAANMRAVEDEKDAQIVLTYFTSEGALEDAYFDSEGLVQVLNPGTYVVDLSPASPNFAYEIYGVSAVSDLHFVGAPIALVNPMEAMPFAVENVMVFAGGEAEDLNAVAGLLAGFGTVKPMKGAGEAQLVRAAHTINQMARIVAAVETRALYRAVEASALDIEADLQVARSALPLGDFREAVLSALVAEQFAGPYTVEMMRGEAAAALAAADDVELVIPQLEAAMTLVELLDVIGGDQMAPAAMGLLFEETEEGTRAGLDWQRAQEVLSRPYDEGEEDDEYDDCGCGHDHDHGAHGHGFAPEYDPYSGSDYDEPYGFDRFDFSSRPQDDED